MNSWVTCWVIGGSSSPIVRPQREPSARSVESAFVFTLPSSCLSEGSDGLASWWNDQRAPPSCDQAVADSELVEVGDVVLAAADPAVDRRDRDRDLISDLHRAQDLDALARIAGTGRPRPGAGVIG